jgi:hypothetical protein
MNMRKWMLGAGALALVGCGGADGSDGSTVEVQALEPGEGGCDSGGTLLTVDGEDMTLCNGSDGAAGEDGADGSDGAAGEDGADGSDGAAGEDGADGSDGFVSVDYFGCYAEPILPSGYVASIFYSSHTFENGYVFTKCSSQSMVTGDVAANIYTPDQAGGVGVFCDAVGDSNMLLDGGWWHFETLANGTRRATYHDVDPVDDGAFYDYVAGDC